MRTAGLALVLVGCGIDDRALLAVPVVAGGAEDQLGATDGGTIVLDEAHVTFADLRLEEPPETDVASLLLRLSPIQAAHAHPGHDYPGAVGGELLGTYDLDLLGGERELGGAAMYEGAYATGRVTLAGSCAAIGGVHRAPDGTERTFRFEIAADQDVIGIPFEAEIDAERAPERIEVRFDPEEALAFVDWTVADADGDGVLTAADGTYGNTVTFGVVATPSWTLELVP